jgi:tRNA (guanine-N7-)-methyltransferase
LVITNEDIAVDLDKCIDGMDLEELFSRTAPFHLEIGSGKGTFLLNEARAHPELNYLGIEWANEFYRYSVDRIRRWGLTNVRILRADARDVIGRFLPDESIAVLHIYFPDPWPKKRHHKRRFFAPANLKHALRCLIKGGELRLATDYADYFVIISDLLLRDPQIAPLFRKIDFLTTDAAEKGEWVGTNFERKYIKEGRQIYTLAVEKLPD